jgi:hypothetical protein
MSWRKLTEEEISQLEDVYKTTKVGRDHLWEAVRNKYPDFKGSQRSVLNDFLKTKTEYQTQRKPDKQSSIAPLQVLKPGYGQCDLVSMRSYADSGYTAFFHVIDGFTKKSWGRPLRGESEVEVAIAAKECIQQSIAEDQKKWTIFQADNGSHFQQIFKGTLENFGIKLVYSQAGRPQSNAFVERRGGDIKRGLFGIMESKGNKKWVENFKTVISNINSLKSFSTGVAPNVLEKGGNVQSAQDKIQKNISNRYKVHKIGKPLFVGQKVRKKRLLQSNVTKPGVKGYWEPQIYTISQRVNSTHPNFLPSYRISDSNGMIQYGRFAKTSLLEIPPILSEDQVANVEDSPAPESEMEHNEIVSPPSTESAIETPRRSLRIQNREEDDTLYEVQHLVGKRRFRGRVQYKVRWLGYDAKDDTWEDESELQETAPDSVREYDDLHTNE